MGSHGAQALRNWGNYKKSKIEEILVLIIVVEICKVGVRIGLPSEMWVEVFVSFLQDQVVFVKCL